MKKSFYPLNIVYRIINGKAHIYLYGTTQNGNQICVIDDSFKPYFYATADETVDLDKLASEIKKIKEEGSHVVDVAKVKKKLNEKETNALQIFTNIPTAVPIIRKAIREWPGVSTYAYDIKFVRRYLIDRGLTPSVLTEVEGEQIGGYSRVPLIKAKKIEQP